tara:strand:- start:127 stop:1332 length:1206 start_codon:yes stop_codon:yes gene_type:complete
LVTKGDTIIIKNPPDFFTLDDSVYTTIDSLSLHPYGSFSDFYIIADTLGYKNVFLPDNLNNMSWGTWEGDAGKKHAADLFETWDGHNYYVINSAPFKEEAYFDFLSQGFIVGLLAIVLFVGLIYNYVRLRLRPIQLMKKRLLALEKGDLESKIKIMGTDELAELSVSFNKLISEIKELINQKHRLLLDVSHELKSPLARMLFLIEMIPPENKQAKELKKEIEFLNDMISNLLLTDKLDVPYSQLELEKIGVLDFFNKVVGFFNQGQQKRIHINTDLSNNSHLLIDLTKMIICIKNIVQNAFKYADTKKGVDISILLSKNMYIVELQDYGPGIKEEDRPHVFESFYRASVSKKISGFGLGLAISKKIIEAHKGTIDLAKDEDGKGCRFVIKIPVLEGRENDK